MCLALALPLAWGAPPARAQSWVGRHSTLLRLEARLATSTSSTERRSLGERLGREGPVEITAGMIAQALSVETEPEVRAVLLVSATRVAVRDPGAALALEPVLISHYEQASPGERPAWARALAALGSPAAIAALMVRFGESSDALVEARAIAPLLELVAGPRTAAQLDAIDALRRIGDRAALEPLLTRLGVDAELDAALAPALATLADESSAPRVRAALLARLSVTEDARTLTSLLDALARLSPSAPEDLDPLVARVTDDDPGVARAALAALARRDPSAALPLLSALSQDREAQILGVLEVSDAPEFVPLAVELAAEAGTRDGALDFLARARSGAGIEALLTLEAPPIAIALAARRAGRVVAVEGLLPTVLAGGPVDLGALSSFEVAVRWEAAMSLAITEHPPSIDLRPLLEREVDARVRAWLLEAARRHHLALDAGWLVHALADRWTSDHERASLILASPFAQTERPHVRRALSRAVSASLRSDRPEVRAAAALALAEMGATYAGASIEALLEDPQASVRIAAGRALLRLAPDRRLAIAARARIDLDPRVRRVLGGAEATSTDVLVLDTAVHGDGDRARVWLEVQTDDGLVRTLPPAPSGVFVLPAVPGATAEVSLQLL